MSAAPRQMITTLRVAEVAGGRVHVEADGKPACGGCAVQSGCAAKALVEMAARRKLALQAPAGRDLVPGEKVDVAMPAGDFLGAAALAYLLPPLALVLAVLVGAALGWPDIVLALLCLPVLALALVPLRRAERNGRLLSSLHIKAGG